MKYRLPLALTCLLTPTSAFAQDQSDPLPESLLGVHVLGECGDPDLAMLVGNPLSLVFDMSGDSLRTVAAPVRTTKNGLELIINDDFGVALPDIDRLTRCPTMPMSAKRPHGEAIALVKDLSTNWSDCRDGPSPACFAGLFASVDVSGDDTLSEAELTRIVRGVRTISQAMPIDAEPPSDGDTSLDRVLVSAEEMSEGMAVAFAATPFISGHVIRTFDYDANGKLSPDEILQDRDAFASTATSGFAEVAGTTAPEKLQELSALASRSVQSILMGGMPDLSSAADPEPAAARARTGASLEW